MPGQGDDRRLVLHIGATLLADDLGGPPVLFLVKLAHRNLPCRKSKMVLSTSAMCWGSDGRIVGGRWAGAPRLSKLIVNINKHNIRTATTISERVYGPSWIQSRQRTSGRWATTCSKAPHGRCAEWQEWASTRPRPASTRKHCGRASRTRSCWTWGTSPGLEVSNGHIQKHQQSPIESASEQQQQQQQQQQQRGHARLANEGEEKATTSS